MWANNSWDRLHCGPPNITFDHTATPCAMFKAVFTADELN